MNGIIMKLSPKCHYTDDPRESEARCARCGKYIQYTHIVIADDGSEIGIGQECVKAMRKSGEIDGRLAHQGRYDWKLSDMRRAAYYDWYCMSLAHAAE